MSDLKKEMRKQQKAYRDYLASDEADDDANPSLAFVIEFFDNDGGANAFLNDRADMWYIANVERYDADRTCFIYLGRYDQMSLNEDEYEDEDEYEGE